MLVGGDAGILRGYQGGGVAAGEEHVLRVERGGAPPHGPILLLSLAFLFLPLLWMDIGIRST